MEAVRIKKRLDSDTIHIPDIKDMIGKEVEIVILVESDDSYSQKRMPGSAKGMITIADDFADPLDDNLIKDFYK